MGAVWEHWQMSKRSSGRDRSGTRLLIVHATAVEMIMCCVNHPISFTQILYAQYPVTPTVCFFIQFPFAIFRTVGYYSSAILAINRFVALCFPIQFRDYWTKQSVNILFILVTWLICGAFYVPHMIGRELRFEMIPPTNVCAIKARSAEARTIHQTLVSHLPLTLIWSIYATMFAFVAVQKLSRRSHQNPASFRRSLQLALVLLMSALWHCVCFSPQPLLTLFEDRGLARPTAETLLWLRFVFLLGYGGNPVIFFTMNRDYRSMLRRWLSSIRHAKYHGWGKKSNNRMVKLTDFGLTAKLQGTITAADEVNGAAGTTVYTGHEFFMA
ncbi:olfactory receptor 10Q1-like [Paramacrobiotus metropolitanus]|uniref:olfactory receptor 10Q1-like n=1 Tax=Paramacrobiotus metropolitanus TaxID=2943436 RepID=UPI00244608F9|nr:olfactory receptor 10Q1-like [Paramacrobiotus metropolitanus]